MTENKNSEKPKKKKLSWWKIAILISLLLLALLTVKITLILTAKPIISVDYVALWNEISKPQNYDPNNDAFFDYQKAVAAFVPIPVEIDLLPITTWPGDFNEPELLTLRQWLADNEHALNYLNQGSQKPYAWIRVFSKDLGMWNASPELKYGVLSQLTRTLVWRAKLTAMEHHLDNAHNDLMTIYRMASQFMGRTPTICRLIGYGLYTSVIRQTCVILTNTNTHSQELLLFQQQLANHFTQSRNELTFQDEKLWIQDVIQRIFTDDGHGNGHLTTVELARELVDAYLQMHSYETLNNAPNFWRDIFGDPEIEEPSDFGLKTRIVFIALFGPDRKQTQKTIDDYFNYIETIVKQTPWQLHNQNIKLQKQIYDLYGDSLLYPLLTHHMQIEFYHRMNNVRQSALLATIAILRYKADTGKLPQTLDELVAAGFLKELPMDPYSNKSIVYRQTNGDFTLYSPAYDLTDEGGDPDTDIIFWPVKKGD